MIPTRVHFEGLLGAALDANLRGRLSHFIQDETSPAIALFAPERREQNREGDWYGEHAGKWLVAAAKAAARSGDAALRASVLRVADYLVDVQEPDGYLGTYAPDHRFMQSQPPKPGTWDGAPSVRTWDIWNHSYLVLGLLEVHRHFPSARYLDAARRIGDLCWQTLGEGGIDITELGNHHGLSATVLMDPAAELYFATQEPRHLQLAERVLEQAESHPQSAILSQMLAGRDASEIATGKAYQLLWNAVGLAKLHRATGRADCLEAILALWANVRQNHLSLGGGPWGGVGSRSREVFNPAGVFDPHAYVETCSTLAWIQLNRELLAITGEPRFAAEIERSAYNDLLGAQAADGEDWCYYSFGNGRRVHTTYWRCCKSSGAMALEELPALACRLDRDGAICVDLYSPGSMEITHPQAGSVGLRASTRYPYDGAIAFELALAAPTRFTIALRVPDFCAEASVRIGAEPARSGQAGQYLRIDRTWQDGDRIEVEFPMQPRAHRALARNIQESRAPDGSLVQQEVLRYEFVGLTRGPLAYATGLVDGYRTAETIRESVHGLQAMLSELPPAAGDDAPRIRLDSGDREALVFEPYFRAGGRHHGAWRLTWLSLAPVPAGPGPDAAPGSLTQ